MVGLEPVPIRGMGLVAGGPAGWLWSLIRLATVSVHV